MADELDKEPVGKGNPPKSTRYKKGTSGNPKGRPKGRANMKSIVRRVAFKEHTLKQEGATLTTIGLIFRSLQKRALEGSLEATRYLEFLREKYQPDEPEVSVSGIIVPPEATIEEFEKECQAARARLRWVQANREKLWEEMGLESASTDSDCELLEKP